MRRLYLEQGRLDSSVILPASGQLGKMLTEVFIAGNTSLLTAATRSGLLLLCVRCHLD